MTVAKKPSAKYVFAVGRRRRSVARVRLYSGKGQTLVSGKSLEDYFKGIRPIRWLKPFETIGSTGKYYVTAVIAGGGRIGQLGAFVHGVSRALVKHNPDFRKPLRDAGLLTRDPRERERRKPGLASGARAAKQSPKR